MTLILSCVTPEYVVQVSDRRLTMLDGSVVERPENKALFYCGFATFSYTGLAKIGQLPTDEWLMAQLAAAPDFSAALPSLATAGTKALRNVNFSRATPAQRRSWRRLAFLGAGFAGLKHPERLGRSPVADQLHPFLVVISNFFDPTLGWLAESGVRFDWFLRWLPEDQERMVFAGGQRVSLREQVELERLLRQCRRHSRSPWPAARILARRVRAISQGNHRVGSNVMCMLLPRPKHPGEISFGSGHIPLVGHEGSEVMAFRKPASPPDQSDAGKHYVYWPGNLDAFPYYGPNLACSDGTQIKGMRFGPDDSVRQEVLETAPLPPRPPRRLP